MEFKQWLDAQACPEVDRERTSAEARELTPRITTPLRYEEATVFDLLSPYQRLEEPRLGRCKPQNRQDKNGL